MKSLTRLGLTALATAGLVAGFAGAANAVPSTIIHTGSRPASHADAGAVFVQTDSTAGNTIAAFHRTRSGSLVAAATYATGGVGASLGGSVVDHTASESSLTYSDGSLFAVNAGSNNITSFAVSGDHLVRRQIIGSGGTFPVSIAARGHLLYVLNARGGGSIQGYENVGGHLVRIPSWNRALGFAPNPIPEFTSTPAQIGFTPDGTKLVVTTKGDSSSIDVFDVNRSGLASRPTVTSVPGAVPFGFTFDLGGHLVITEAGTNAIATFTINSDGTATPIAVSPTGQKATCWIVADGHHLYASNAGSGTVSAVGDNGSGALVAEGNTVTDAGTVDAAVTPEGTRLYVQTGATGTVDEFAVTPTGALVAIGSVAVPGAIGGEGIVAR
jgi:6-phosphogluconolactonase (cycloisomerase 2 family)